MVLLYVTSREIVAYNTMCYKCYIEYYETMTIFLVKLIINSIMHVSAVCEWLTLTIESGNSSP